MIAYQNPYVVQRQAPDSVITGSSYSAQRDVMVRVSPGTLADPLRYEGGSFCDPGFRLRRGPVVMEEVIAGAVR